MRALLQRVTQAQVHVDDTLVGACGPGLLVLVCAMQGDDDHVPTKLAAKIAKLRMFRDDDGRMNRSIVDVGGEALVVSQFTLAADTSRGSRPGFSASAAPDVAERLYDAFAEEMGMLVPTQTGRFGADMAVSLVNDGPVTLWLDTDA